MVELTLMVDECQKINFKIPSDYLGNDLFLSLDGVNPTVD